MHTLLPDTAKVQLSRMQSEALLGYAVSSTPEECCGVLLGQEVDGTFRVSHARAVPNRANDRQRAFSIAAADVGQHARSARLSGHDLLGFYHSHPTGPAYPSQRDITEGSAFAGMLHLIIGLEHGKSLNAWLTGPANWTQIAIQEGG